MNISNVLLSSSGTDSARSNSKVEKGGQVGGGGGLKSLVLMLTPGSQRTSCNSISLTPIIAAVPTHSPEEGEKFSSLPQPLRLSGLDFLESSRVSRHCVPRIYGSLYNVLGEARNFTSTTVFLVFKLNRISLDEKNPRKRAGEQATAGK